MEQYLDLLFKAVTQPNVLALLFFSVGIIIYFSTQYIIQKKRDKQNQFDFDKTMFHPDGTPKTLADFKKDRQKESREFFKIESWPQYKYGNTFSFHSLIHHYTRVHSTENINSYTIIDGALLEIYKKGYKLYYRSTDSYYRVNRAFKDCMTGLIQSIPIKELDVNKFASMISEVRPKALRTELIEFCIEIFIQRSIYSRFDEIWTPEFSKKLIDWVQDTINSNPDLANSKESMMDELIDVFERCFGSFLYEGDYIDLKFEMMRFTGESIDAECLAALLTRAAIYNHCLTEQLAVEVIPYKSKLLTDKLKTFNSDIIAKRI